MRWTGVLSGFVLSFLLGWFGCNPKWFGTRWAAGVGISLDDNSGMTAALVTQALATFGLAWRFGITATRDALLTIILFIVSNGNFARKSGAAIGIEAGFLLATGGRDAGLPGTVLDPDRNREP